MKVDDSGMPEETYWNSLFDIEGIVDWLAIPKNSTIVEIGCGYGTFTVPIAKKSAGEIYTFDHYCPVNNQINSTGYQPGI